MPNSFDYLGRVKDVFFPAYLGQVAELAVALENNPERQQLLNHKAEKQTNHTPLFFACYGASNVETVALLIHFGKKHTYNLAADTDMMDRTPAHYAANSASVEILEELDLRYPLSADMLDVDNRSIAHALFMEAQDPASKHDVDATYNFIRSKLGDEVFSIEDKFGYTAIDYAFKYYPEIATKLGFEQNAEEVELPVGFVDFFGRNKLLEAAFVNKLDIVKAEIERDASLANSANDMAGGRTALHLACCGIADSTMVEFLLDAGADPLAVDSGGSSALHFAANAGRLDTVTELLKNEKVKSSLCNTDSNNLTALHVLALAGTRMKERMQVFDLLVDAEPKLAGAMDECYKLAKENGHTRLADHIWFKMRTPKVANVADMLWNFGETVQNTKFLAYSKLPSIESLRSKLRLGN